MDIVKVIELFVEHAPALLGWGVALFAMVLNLRRSAEERQTTEKVLDVINSNTEALTSFRVLLEERVPKGN